MTTAGRGTVTPLSLDESKCQRREEKTQTDEGWLTPMDAGKTVSPSKLRRRRVFSPRVISDRTRVAQVVSTNKSIAT